MKILKLHSIRIGLLALLLQMLTTNAAYASMSIEEHPFVVYGHQLRLYVSDGLPLRTTDFIGMGLTDITPGTERNNIESWGIIGIGYRCSFYHFRLGIDCATARITSDVRDVEQHTTVMKEKVQHYLVLPTAEWIYYKFGNIELYGSGSSGIDVSRQTYKGLTPQGKLWSENLPDKSSVKFAYQINPIAIRLGRKRIVGYAEMGLGYKGFITLGLSITL